MKEILELINPLRVLKVEDFEKILEIVGRKSPFTTITQLLKRYESLTSQELRKEMFVCETYKIDVYDKWLANKDDDGIYDKITSGENASCSIYHEAQSKVWFGGFEYKTAAKETIMGCGINTLINKGESTLFINSPIPFYVNTVYDFIYEIDRYNRTTQEPIQINLTENFVKQLIQ